MAVIEVRTLRGSRLRYRKRKPLIYMRFTWERTRLNGESFTDAATLRLLRQHLGYS